MPRQADWKRRAERMERKWLAADAVICEAYEVARCAQERYGNADEAAASILVDATARILSTYVMTEEGDCD